MLEVIEQDLTIMLRKLRNQNLMCFEAQLERCLVFSEHAQSVHKRSWTSDRAVPHLALADKLRNGRQPGLIRFLICLLIFRPKGPRLS